MAFQALAAVLLGIGILAGVAGIGLMYYSVEDEERNDGWFFKDAERTDENLQRYTLGRILSVGGLVVLVAGALVGLGRSP